jgi:hypothetical protein
MQINAAIFVLALGLPGAIFAQGQAATTPAQNPPATSDSQSARPGIRLERKPIPSDLKGMKALDAQHAAAIKGLDAVARTAVQAVKANSTLTAAQQKAQIADIRKAYSAQRKAADLKYREDRKKLLTESHQERRVQQTEAQPQ